MFLMLNVIKIRKQIRSEKISTKLAKDKLIKKIRTFNIGKSSYLSKFFIANPQLCVCFYRKRQQERHKEREEKESERWKVDKARFNRKQIKNSKI